jgi:hypothetical protein
LRTLKRGTDAVLFLVSEESRNISGQLLTVAAGNNPSL